jgi:hypothetical protein
MLSLATGANGVTVHVDGCESACGGNGMDMYSTTVGLNRMLAHLFMAQARGGAVTISYQNPGPVPGRCELTAVGTN